MVRAKKVYAYVMMDLKESFATKE